MSEAAFSALVERLEAAVEALEKRPAADDLLDVAAVKARYRLADDRAARKVMHEAGAFPVGGRLFVRRADLERLEAARIDRPRVTAGGGRAHRPHRRDAAELKPGFWRT